MFTVTFILIAAILMVIVGVSCAKHIAKVNRVPQNYLTAGILVLTVLGAFSTANSFAHVYIMIVCGILGYFLKRMNTDLSAVVLGFILGPVLDKGLVRTITKTGSFGAMVESVITRPICIVLLAVSLISFGYPLIRKSREKKKAAKAEAAKTE